MVTAHDGERDGGGKARTYENEIAEGGPSEKYYVLTQCTIKSLFLSSSSRPRPSC